MSLFLYSILLLNCLFKMVQLLRIFFTSGSTTPVNHIMIHMTVLESFMFLSIWYYILYLQYPDVHSAIVTMTLRGNLIGDGNCT